MLIPAFENIARRENLTLSVSVQGGCPWQRHLYTTFKPDKCERIQEDEYKRVITRLHPDVIVLMEFSYGSPGPYPLALDSKRNRADDATVASASTASVAALSAGSSKLLIIEPTPLPLAKPNFDPLACLEQAKIVEACRYTTNSSPLPLERAFRALARRDKNVFTIDLDREICPLLPVCDPVLNGRVVKWDQSHVTSAFAIALASEIDAVLKTDGLIPLRST